MPLNFYYLQAGGPSVCSSSSRGGGGSPDLPLRSPRRLPSVFLLLALFLLFAWEPCAGQDSTQEIEDGSFPVLEHPWEIAILDANNDGKQDLAVNASVYDSVGILLGNGDGTFQNPLYHWGGYGSQSLAAGDFNEDGIPDVVVAATDSNFLLVLEGAGDGGFGDSLVLLTGLYPANVITLDLNYDGHLDIVTSNAHSDDIGTYLGMGNGNFTGPILSGIPGGPRSPELWDFDEDGKLDVVVSLREEIDRLGVLFGDGAGSFHDPLFLDVGNYPRESVVGDYNRDGHGDIAVLCRLDNNVNVLLGDGEGGFSAPATFMVGVGPRYIISEDVDGDGVQDLIATNFYGNSLSVLLGDGAGGFLDDMEFDTGSNPRGLALGDFDSDGRPDLAVNIFGEDRISIVLDVKDDATPYLISPAYGALIPGDPVFQWKDIPGADAYQLALYDDAGGFLWGKFVQGRSQAAYDGTELLLPGNTYWWSVREREGNKWRAFAPLSLFRKVPGSALPSPVLSLPAEGQTIALPELMSCLPIEGAARYEFAVYADSTGSLLLFEGQSDESSLLVPAGIPGMAENNSYYWRVGGIDQGGYPGSHSELRRFVLAGSVPAPDAPLPVSPIDPDTVSGTSVTFVWHPSPGATRFSLEFSRDSLFIQSSDMTWNAERITDSTYTASLREGISRLHWRVKGVNNGGESSWSPTSGLTFVGGTVPPIQAVTITEPRAGSQVALGSSFLPHGKVTGSYSGTVEGLWSLDGAPLDSFSVVMDPLDGAQVEGPVIHAGQIGQHLLVLAVTMPASVSSPPLAYSVAAAPGGPVTGLHLVASPFAIAADSQSQCTVTAYAVDALGNRVRTDFARPVSFVVVGEGFIVGPAFALSDSGAVSVSVSSTKSPDPDVLVFAYSPGITAGYTYFMTYDEDLEEYVARILAHMERLENLPLDYYPPGFDTTLAGYDLTGVREFLDDEILGVPDPLPESVESLKRLSLALGFLDMNYDYAHDPLFPEEELEPLHGTGYFYDQISGAASGAAIAADYLSVMADRVLRSEGAARVLGRVSHSITRNSQHMFDGLAMPLVEDELASGRAGSVLEALLQCHREAALFARQGADPLALSEDFTLRLPRHTDFLAAYVSGTQDLVDSAASWSRGHIYASTFQESRSRVDDLLLESRSMTNTSFLESEDLDADGSFLLSARELSLLGEAISQGTDLPLLATKLREVAEYVAYPERWEAGGDILPLSLATLAELESRLLSEGVWTSFGMEPASMVAGRGREAFPLASEDKARIGNDLLTLSEESAEFEALARGIISSVSSDDSAAVAEGLEGVCDAGDRILELLYCLRGTFGSMSPGARGTVGDFEAIRDQMSIVYHSATSALTSFEISLVDYLANREYTYARTLAVDAGTECVASVNQAVSRFFEIIPSFFDLPAMPALVVSHPSFPDSVGPLRIFGVSAFLKNAGAGVASGITATLSFEGPFELLSSASQAVPSLAAGDSALVSWVLRIERPVSPELVRGLYSYSVLVESPGSIAYPRVFLLKAYRKSFGANKDIVARPGVSETREASVPRTYGLSQNSPNPFNPQTLISYDIPAGQPQDVRLRVYDVRGRLLCTLVDEVKGPGSYSVTWDGRASRGEAVGTGVYFCVMDAGEFHSVRKMLLRK